MSFYDTYDENGVYLSTEDDTDVHYKGLWHKVMRIWLYDVDGNLYLREKRDDHKLDAINEIHILSTEGISTCFDRGMYEKLGIHFPASSNIQMIKSTKFSKRKLFTNNTEMRDNYFLCDYIGEFDKNANFLMLSEDTERLVRVNAKGILALISSRGGEIVGYDVSIVNDDEKSKIFLGIRNIYEDDSENTYNKFKDIVAEIDKISLQHKREESEKEKMAKYVNRNNDSEDFSSHANENEGADIY